MFSLTDSEIQWRFGYTYSGKIRLNRSVFLLRNKKDCNIPTDRYMSLVNIIKMEVRFASTEQSLKRHEKV